MNTKLKRYTDPISFHERVASYLVQYEAENNLMFGILANVMAGDYREVTPYMAVVEQDEKIEQVLLRTPPHPILMSYREHAPSDEVVHLVVNDLHQTYGEELSGITTDKQIIQSYVDAWQSKSGKQGNCKVAMRIYKLTQVKSVSSNSGTMRHITETDRDLVVKWILGFNRDTIHEEMEHEKANKNVSNYLHNDIARRGLVLWDMQGTSVSMAGYSGPTPHGIRINAVYTPPALRRQGYASACVGALSQYLLDKGYTFCFLFTDLSNSTSNHIYQELGYTAVSDVDSYLFT